ncbi:MAG: Asp-tRNA(Asn)/Glu-tRNA(Gln) amidotransferase subunit GatC [Patescibacteria group bacterium]
MSITNDEIKYVAGLARLELSAAEIKKFSGQLNGILEYIGQLKGVDTTRVKAAVSASGLMDVWRTDEIKEWPRDEVEAALNQGELEGGRIRVKRVL